MPSWNRRNLRKHHRKRITEDKGCFEDLLRVVGETMTESQYELRADDAFHDAWGEYEGIGWNVEFKEYNERRAYFVDKDLVVAITGLNRREFVTCFHEHFDCKHGMVPGAGASPGQKRLRYIDRLRTDSDGKAILELERIRGV